MSDLKTLLAAEEANRSDHAWLIAFTVRVHDSVLAGLKQSATPCPGCGETHESDEEIATITDTLTVGGHDDAQPAVDRARAHVLDEVRFGVKTAPNSFKLKGVKLLSVQEI